MLPHFKMVMVQITITLFTLTQVAHLVQGKHHLPHKPATQQCNKYVRHTSHSMKATIALTT